MPELFWVTPDDGRWALHLTESQDYDTYHLPDYHRLSERCGEGTPRLVVYHEEERFIALPLLIRPVEGSDVHDATSAYGYPGPISSRVPITDEMVRRFQSHLASFLTSQRIVTVFSRLNPLLPQQHVLSGLGQLIDHGATVSIDLSLSSAPRRAEYRANHRRDIRALANSGFSCEIHHGLTDIDEFRRIYYQTMQRVDADPYYYFDERYFDLMSSLLSNKVSTVVCRHGQSMAAAAIMFVSNGIAQFHLGATCNDYLQWAPFKLVLDQAAEAFNAMGARVLHLGGGVGGHEDSVFAFKAGFSRCRHAFQTWRWVVWPEKYDELCRSAAKHVAKGMYNPHFFPPYRRKGVRQAGYLVPSMVAALLWTTACTLIFQVVVVLDDL